MRSIFVVLLLVAGGRTLYAQAVVSGHVGAGRLPDTVTVLLFDEFTTYREASASTWKRQVITQDGNFSVVVPVTAGGCSFSLSDPQDGLRPLPLRVFKYPINPGDSIHVKLDERQTLFSGRGAEKLLCFSQIMKLRWARIKSPIYSELAVNPENLFGFFAALDYAGALELDVLRGFKDRLDTLDYFRMQADVLGEIGLEKYRYAVKYLNGEDTVIRARLLKGVCERLCALPMDTAHAAAYMYSDQYVEYAVRKAESDHAWLARSGSVVDMIRSRYTGGFRDKVILEYLNRRVAFSEITDADLQLALQIVHTGRYAERVQGLYDSFGRGKPAVNFEFSDRSGRRVRLSDYRGKVVFLDLWFTGCSGCISVANALPGVEAAFAGRKDVVFVSISIDTDRALWLRSISPKGNEFSHKWYTHYTTASTHYLYTSGRGFNDPFIERYVPTNTYPHLLLIDKMGRIYAADPPRPDLGNGREELIGMIGKAAGE